MAKKKIPETEDKLSPRGDLVQPCVDIITFDRRYAASEDSTTYDIPVGYFNGKNWIQYDFEKLRPMFLPVLDDSHTVSGTINTIFIDTDGLTESIGTDDADDGDDGVEDM